MSRKRRKRKRAPGTYFLYNQDRKEWVSNIGGGYSAYDRYSRDFGKAMRFRNFKRAIRFKRPSDEVRRLVWKWWIFARTKKVTGEND